MNPKPNEIYRHFKGNLYKIMAIATHSETGEQMVVYQALYGDFAVYVRPLSMFLSKVDREKYPEADQEYRFELVEETDSDGESVGIDPLVLEFLDAETMAQKRNILTALHHRITDDMINTLAVSLDVVVEEGDLEDRYVQLKTCITTKEKFECERI